MGNDDIIELPNHNIFIKCGSNSALFWSVNAKKLEQMGKFEQRVSKANISKSLFRAIVCRVLSD